MIEFDIPVKPYLHKYLCQKFGSQTKLSRNGLLGRLAFHLLRKSNEDRQYDQVVSRYQNRYRLLAPRHFVTERGTRNLSSLCVMEFNSTIDELLKLEFYTFMQLHVEAGMMYRDAIYKFREQYDFQEEDLAFETLKKSFYRYRSSTLLTRSLGHAA